MTVTVTKTIGTTGTFSTLTLWESGAPADLTTAEKSAAGTFLVAAFTQGETLSFVGSGAAGKFLHTDSTGAGNGTYVVYGLTSGNPAASDVVTGATSGATCVLSSGTPMDTGIIWRGEAQNQSFSVFGTTCTIAGSTVSSSCYKHLTTVAGASFRDNANVQSNALKYNTSNGTTVTNSTIGFPISVQEANARISNLMCLSGASSSAIGCGNATATTFWIDNCILEGLDTLGLGNSSTGKVTNSMLYKNGSGTSALLAASTSSVDFYNCTLVVADDFGTAPTNLITISTGNLTFKNCGVFGGDSSKTLTSISSTGTATFTTCYTDVTGTTGITQVTYGNQFENVNNTTRDYRLKSGADMIDTGTTDSTNAPTDIAGTTRPSGSAYDVGCWEFVVASAIKTVMGLAKASVKTVNGLAIASIKTINGLA